jgi:hypothetical protein
MIGAVIEGLPTGAYYLYVRIGGTKETGAWREIDPAAHETGG